MNDIWETLKNEKRFTRHYYGDLVRFLFMLGGVVMILTLPFLIDKLPVPVFISIFIILAVGILAGITNPLQKWVAAMDSIISVGGLSTFEYFATKSYVETNSLSLFFITNQVLAIIFLFALYYSVKTLRAMFLNNKK